MQTAESADDKIDSTPEQQAASTPEQQAASTPEQQAATPGQTDPNDVNAKTLTQLNTLMEDLHNALQVITQFLGFSTNVHPGIFNLPADSTITLLPNLELMIRLSNGKTETKRFTDYSPETITAIVEYVTPLLLELIQKQKSYLTEKITFLRTATKQLSTLSQLKENIPSIAVPNEE